MKQVSKVFNVYQFNELSQEAQERVLKDNQEVIINDRFRFFDEETTAFLEVEYDLKNPLLLYDFNHSQGSGFSFSVDTFNTPKVVALLLSNPKIKNELWLKSLIETYNPIINIGVLPNQSNGYTYHHNNQVHVSLKHGEATLNLEALALITKVKDAFASFYVSICKKIETNAYESMNITLKDVEDYAQSNGLEFLESGEAFYE
jgi:hypothetical protein